MNKYLLFALGLNLALSATAQNKMQVTLSDGNIEEFNTSSISNVQFYKDNNNCTITLKNGTVKQYDGNVSHIGFKKQTAFDATNARTISYSMGLGWNLGNQMDAQNNGVSCETCWGNQETNQQVFDKLKEYGFSTIRIPVTWMGHIDDNNNYKIEDAWMNRVDEIVTYAEKAGLKAIINLHHDGADSQYWLSIKQATADPNAKAKIEKKIAAVWKQIAEHFKERGDFLIFESFNEIHDGDWGYGANLNDGGKQYGILNEWNQLFVDVVRSTGYENKYRYLGIPGYSTNPEHTKNYLVMPNDVVENRILVAVHGYDPYDYATACKFNEWGHTGKDLAEWGEEGSIDWTFNYLKERFIDQNIPLYLGEYGAVHRDTESRERFRLYYLEYVTKSARDHGFGALYWDNGSTKSGMEAFGIINHNTGNYINNGKDVVDVLRKAYYNNDPNYNLQSIYNSAPPAGN